jgi:hypothetical protein
MAFDAKKYGGYGTGALGDVANPTGQINSYANVTAYTPTTITIGGPANGSYGTFIAGQEILVHVSATNGTSTDTTYLGKYMTCKITAVAGSVLTVDNDFTVIMPVTEFAKYQVQVVTIAQFGSLTLSTGTVTPLAYSVSNKYGGIVAIKCKDTLTMSGGSINLVDKGIPVASVAYRPKTTQETQGTLDADKYAGWENHITVRQMLMNCGDGVAFVMVKNFAQTGTVSRIGGTVAGAQFCRGASDSAGLTAGTTNIGGSTILLIADGMSGFDPSIISKVRATAGQGLGRCYIASNNKLKADEGLYAYDCVSNNTRVMKSLNIKDYGTGRHNAISSTPTHPLNNYALLTSVDSTGKVITYSNLTTNGMATFDTGSGIMIHVSKVTSTDYTYINKFMLAKIVTHDTTNKQIIIDKEISAIIPLTSIANYNIQIVSVFEPTALTMNTQYTATTAWNNTTKTGGICAIMASTNIDLTNGGIIVKDKGGNVAFTENDAFAYYGQTQCNDVLPLGSYGGAIFISTPLLKLNSASRLGNTWDGAGVSKYSITSGQKGYDGGTWYNPGGAGGIGKRVNAPVNVSIVIIANQIIGANIHAISTGGADGSDASKFFDDNGRDANPGLAGAGAGVAGAGYGGSGGNGTSPQSDGRGHGGTGGFAGAGGGGGGQCGMSGRGAGGAGGNAGCNGGAGWHPTDYAGAGSGGGGGIPSGYCFIYCNSVENEDVSGVVI